MPIDIWLNGELYASVKSLYAAEKLLNYPHILIRDHLNKGTPTEKGFSFTLKEKKDEESEV